jgi:hypothetical protein
MSAQLTIQKQISMDQLIGCLNVMMPADEVQGDIARHKGFKFRPSTRTWMGASFVETNRSGDCIICGPADDIDYVLGLVFALED